MEVLCDIKSQRGMDGGSSGRPICCGFTRFDKMGPTDTSDTGNMKRRGRPVLGVVPLPVKILRCVLPWGIRASVKDPTYGSALSDLSAPQPLSAILCSFSKYLLSSRSRYSEEGDVALPSGTCHAVMSSVISHVSASYPEQSQ